MFAGLDRAAVDVRTELIVTDDVAEVRLGAVLLAVVDELGGGVPFHGELALADGELARLERNLVVGVGTVGLRRRQGVATLAHGLAALAGDGDALKGLALDELALGDLPAQSGIAVAIRLEGVQSGNRDRERGDLECHLALDRLAVDRDVIVDRHLAGVLDARSNVRPAAVGGLVLNDGTLGQLRGIDKVLLAVVLAGVALNSQGGDFDRARLMAAYGARTVLGAGLGNRRQLVGRPVVRMLGVHLNLTGLRVVGRILSHDFMLGADIAFSSLNRIPAVLISLELFTVIGNRHRLVAVIEHVKRNALAIGIACIEVINGGRIGVYVGIGLCVIPLIAANPADLLTNAIGLRRGGHNDLVLPSAVLPYLSLLAVLANLKVRSFIALLPGSIIGNRVRAPLDLSLGIGRRIVVVILGIAYIVSTCQKPGQLAVRRYLLVFPTRPATIFHRLGHARDGTVLAAARSPIIAHKPSRRVLIGLGNLHGRLARNGQIVGSRHTVTGRALARAAIRRLFRRPISAVFTVLDLHTRRNGVILNVDRNAMLFAVIGTVEVNDLKVETFNINNLPFERQNTCGAAISRKVALTDDNALILSRLGLLQPGFTSSIKLIILALNEIDPLIGAVLELCAFNDRLMLLAVIGILARALAAVFKDELVGLTPNQAALRNLEGLLALERLTGGGLKARNDIVVASVRRSILELGAILIRLGIRLRLALIPRELVAGRHAHLLQIPRAVLIQSDLDRATIIDKLGALRARRLRHGKLVRGPQVLFGLAILALTIFALAVAERTHARCANTKAVSFDLPLVLVDGLAEGKVAVEVHNLVFIGVAIALG